MIRISYRGRLGNHLFQYAYARIAAEALGLFLGPHRIDGFGCTTQRVRGNRCHTTPAYVPAEGELPESLPTDHAIAVEGFHQQWPTMCRHRESIRRWFALPAWEEIHHDDDILVSVRLGDYLSNGDSRFQRAIPHFKGFYEGLFDRLRPRRINLISDEPHHPYIATQFPAICSKHLSPFDQLRYMGSFRRIIICQSTFAWWGAFLSERLQESYIPMPRGSLWQAHSKAIATCDIPGWHMMDCQSILDAGEDW